MQFQTNYARGKDDEGPRKNENIYNDESASNFIVPTWMLSDTSFLKLQALPAHIVLGFQ